MNKDEYSDKSRQARSRICEYPFVIKTIEGLGLNNPTIHNTGCGGGEIHLLFARELNKYGAVINTDNDSWKWKYLPNNYKDYDILKPCEFKSDIVLCISTLEHLKDQVLALKNLLNATKEGGYLIVTLDSPPVNLKAIEDYLGIECKVKGEKLNQRNSAIPNPAFVNELNIVKLVIQK